jgi:hypothetical protein
MPEEPDYILDLSGCETPSASDADDQTRPWIGVNFDCCGVYARIYRNREGTLYIGRCPRCLAKVEVRVGRGGTDQRIFRAS